MSLSTLANWCQVLAVLVFPVLYYGYRHFTKEFKNNGGSSMRDAMDELRESNKRIEKNQRADRKELRRIANVLESHLADFE